MERYILHCDCNSFYASVELLSHPELKNSPVAVCGDPESRHGIILAKNEPAKACGVKTAETIWQAKKKCPELVLLPAHHNRYAHYSKRVNAIYEEYTDLVEPFGIDESWLDISGTVHLFGGDPKAVADTLRRRVKEELGLTISVGVSFNKVFAKLGSDYKKPDATTVISPSNWRRIVWPMPLSSLLFAGPAAQRTLERFGIHTIGQLAAMDVQLAERLLGKTGRQLWNYANGQDTSPVRPQHETEPVKSEGNSYTFKENLTTHQQIRHGLSLLCDSVATRLRQQNLYCGAVQVTLRDASFRTVSRQKQLPHSTHLMRELQAAASELISHIWIPGSPVRLIGVTALHLTDQLETYEQTDLFSTQEVPRSEKQEKLEQTMDRIRQKYGSSSISFGHGSTSAAGQPSSEGESAEREKFSD